MTQCAPDRQCESRCCDPVMLPYNRIEAMTDNRIPLADRRWAERYLSAMPVKEAWAKAPWLKERRLADVDGTPLRPFYFRCAALDPVTKACGIYDDRPGTCRGYPWYGGQPRPDAALPPACSFNRDLGREPVPVALTRKVL